MKKSNILIFLFILLSQYVFSQDKIVRLATLGGYPPYCILTDETVPVTQMIPVGTDAVGFEGLTWDIVRESYHEMGYTIQLSIYPWERGKHALEIGLCDALFPTGKNDQRLKIYNFSKNFVNYSDFLVYIRKDDDLKMAWTEKL